MFRKNRPSHGRMILSPVAASLTALIFCACAPKSEAVDTWQMQPPTLEATNANGVSFQMKSSDFLKTASAESTLMVNEAAALKFADVDQGLSLNTRSTCVSVSGTKLEYVQTTKTASQVPLLTLLPPTILSPESLMQEWTCTLQLKARNSIGSVHQFTFTNVKMNLKSSVDRLKSGTVLAADDQNGIRGDSARRLICSTWWVDSIDAELNAMARKTKVNGEDSRAVDRQPVCTLVELSSKPVLIGFFRPAFANPRIVWKRENLIPKSEVANLFNRPVLTWSIRNDEPRSQLIFIPYKASRVRFSLLHNSDGTSPAAWTKPLLAAPIFTVTGADEIRETSVGIYVRIQPAKTVLLQMQSNRPALASRANFVHPNGHRYLVITTEQPVSIMTLAAERITTPLVSTDVTMLDQAPRDTFRPEKDTLLGTLFLEGDPAQVTLRETSMTPLEATRLGAQSTAADCFERTATNLVEPAE